MTQIITNSNGGGGGVGVYKYKGSVNSYEDLPSSGMKIGDVYNVVNAHTTAPIFPDGSNVAWTGTEWDVLGGSIDLSDYQKKLVEGEGIDLDQDTNEISVESSIIEGAAAGATALQPNDNVSELVNDAGYIDNTVDDLTNYTKTSDLAAVALSNDYDDLDDKPTIGAATITIQKNGTKVDDFGVNDASNTTVNITMDKSDVGLSNVDNTSDLNKPISTATQTALDGKQVTLVSGANIKTINNTSILGSGNIDTNQVSDTAYGSSWDGVTDTAPSKNAVYDKINGIDGLIPSTATTSNQLADKNYVNDSINSVTAYYITKNAQGDAFATYAELSSATTFYSGGVARTPTRNDYCIVLADETHSGGCTRYSYQGTQWEYQYTVNESPMTQAQLDALNSGITAGKVATYDGYATSKQDKLVNQSNIKSINNNSLLGSGNLTLNDVKVSTTAPSSPTEGMVWYDTTHDQLKVYDGTNWNVAGKEYNAGNGINIENIAESDMQGPCPDGFHVPTTTEFNNLITYGTTLGAFTLGEGTKLGIYYKIPLAGRRSTGGGVSMQGTNTFLWHCNALSNTEARGTNVYATSISITNNNAYANGMSVRPFKNIAVVPDNTWTVLFQGTGSAGIFRNQTQGIISVSTNGTDWLTIADKNCGATVAYNDGDTLSEANCGKYYQRGNNYGFAWTGSVTTSSTQVDATNYGPGNYYNSGTFITSSGNWSSVRNDNLWGGVTMGYTDKSVISNNGVLSVNGLTGNVSLYSTITVTLTTAGWSSNTQTVTATGVTASNTVIISPAPSSFSDYTSAVIYCSAQGSNSLTFTCTNEPTSNITVNVMILN